MTKGIDLLNYNRFDVTAKTIFLRYVNKNINSEFGKEVYKHHLQVWNGLMELNPPKKGVDQYINTFLQIQKDMLSGNFDWNKSPILINNGNVINGSHRLAVSLYHKLDVIAKDVPPHFGESCSYYHLNSFRNNVPTGLSTRISDAMSIEFVRLCKNKNNVYMVTIFPSADSSKIDQCKKILKDNCNIVYEKKVYLNKTGGMNLVRQLYLDESWMSNRKSFFGGGKQKSDACYTQNRDTNFILIECKPSTNLVDMKSKIRSIYGLGKHSVHINDTWNETFRIATLAFNSNSIHALNNMKETCLEYNTFHSLLDQYRHWVWKSGIDMEDVCVDSSAVLSAYGLRDCKDLDVLHHGNVKLMSSNPSISSHNSWAHHYTTSISNIIYNPDNHFWYNGVKFASLDIVKKMKQKRNEDKDIKDVSLINLIGE